MNQIQRARRVGLCAVCCALLLRLWSWGLPGQVLAMLQTPEAAALITYLETGRDVRFSPSLKAFTPNFMESPAALAVYGTESPLPYFSDPEGVELYYAAKVQPDIAALLSKPLIWELSGEEPTVLILHTHSTESYTRKGENYRESSPWRTLDEGYNMLSIGQIVADRLEKAGIHTLQYRELNDYPSYNGSYTRARKVVEEYLEEYPSIRLILDLHRDAAGSDTRQMRTLAQVEGQDCAQLMLVIGTNHEDFGENLSLALKLHALLERQDPGITRPLQLRASRFNQDLSPGSLLVEVGAAGNSHSEAVLAAEKLAEGIIALSRGTAEEYSG